MATATEEEEYNGWEGTDPQHHLDNALLRLADVILLRSIATTTVGAVAAAAVGSPAIATMSMPVVNVGELFIGWEEQEGDDGSSIMTEEDNDVNAEAREYARDYLEIALSQLWEGLFGRRTTTAKTMETSRDDKHEEYVVPRSMFETLCKGMRREMRHGHCRCRPLPAAAGRLCRPPPLEDEAPPAWSLSSSSDGASLRDVARMTATTEWGIHL